MRNPLLFVMTALVVACGSDQSPQPETAQTAREERATTGGEVDTSARGAMAANCPMHVPGTTVQVDQIDGGAALTFVTTGDVEALRERVRNMAAMHDSHAMQGQARAIESARPDSADQPSAGAKIGDADDGVTAGGMPQDSTARTMAVDADTRVEDVEGGARLVLVATNPGDVDTLRIQTEQQAQRMSGRECPMAPHAM